MLAMIVGDKRAKGRGLNGEMVYGLTVASVVFGFLAAKILFIITQWRDFIADPIAFISSSGFVVYGGLIGGIATAIIYCKLKKQNGIDYLDLMVPSVALAQGMGRIGCFLAGCCYGKPTDLPIGITFTHSAFAPNNVSLIPTQLIMSAGDFIIAVILFIYSRKDRKRGQITLLWLLLYSIGRFFVEFLRGDVARGSVGVLSTSQFIAVIVAPLCILAFIFVVPLLEKGRTVAVTEDVTQAPGDEDGGDHE
jgi:phosphatidylglycerol:prolipoprotein diacylglycerol transferase